MLSTREPVPVSVVIATYNAAGFLPTTIQSILAQDHEELEIVIVDDGSEDDTARVLEPYLGERVRYLRRGHTGGPSAPRNEGVRQCRGKHVFFFDSDDIMLPGKISRSVELLERAPQIGLLFTNFVVMDREGRPAERTFLEGYRHFQSLPRRRVGENLYVLPREAAHEALVFENYIGCSSVAVPAAVLREVGGFDESLGNAEDHDLWFRIARRHDLGYVDIVGHRYRTHGGSILGRPVERLAPNRIESLRRQIAQGLSPRAEREARRLIAQNYFNMGYEQWDRGRRRAARAYYRQGLREAILWPLVKGWLRTFLDPGIPVRAEHG